MKDKDYSQLYSEKDRNIMKCTEDSLDPHNERVSELIAFATEAGYKKIGIANCISFEKEAIALKELFEESGFMVEKVNCKLGKMAAADILPGYKGVSCNPVGQAHYLKASGVEMNIVIGLCLGHDMVFNLHTDIPTTTLVVKDRVLSHNPLEYFKKK